MSNARGTARILLFTGDRRCGLSSLSLTITRGGKRCSPEVKLQSVQGVGSFYIFECHPINDPSAPPLRLDSQAACVLEFDACDPHMPVPKIAFRSAVYSERPSCKHTTSPRLASKRYFVEILQHTRTVDEGRPWRKWVESSHHNEKRSDSSACSEQLRTQG